MFYENTYRRILSTCISMVGPIAVIPVMLIHAK